MEGEEDFVGTIQPREENGEGESSGSDDDALEVGGSFFDGVDALDGSASTKQHAWDLTVAIRAAKPLESYRTTVEEKIAARKSTESDAEHAEDGDGDEDEDGEEGDEDEDGEEGDEDDEEGGKEEEEVVEDVSSRAVGDEEVAAGKKDEGPSKKGKEAARGRKTAPASVSKDEASDGGRSRDVLVPKQEVEEDVVGESMEDTLTVKQAKRATGGEKAMRFTELRLSKPLLKAVSALEWEILTPIQERAIPLVLAGRDVCGSAVTGSGKTAAFVLPILERLLQDGQGRALTTRVLILMPTRELAVQCQAVVTSLSRFCGIQAGLAVGGLSNKAQEASLRARPEVLVATPGRLIDHVRNAQGFSLEDVEILVMDEADRLLEMGFRDEVEEIVRLCPTKRQTLLFSATMTTQVQWLVKLSLRSPAKVTVNPKFDVAAKLSQEFVRLREKTEPNRDAVLLSLVTRTFRSKTIIFFTQKHEAHKFRIIFGLAGLSAGELHGNLTQAQRLSALQNFRDGKVNYLLCTDLAARGLDIVGVHTVINYQMPKGLTEYVHRVGRTARAGKDGKAVSIVGESERKLLREIHRKAKDQLALRKVPNRVVESWRKRIDAMAADIDEVLKEERREKELRMADVQLKKAENLLTHEQDIYSRPKRTWFQSQRAKDELKKESHTEKGGARGREKPTDDPDRKRTRVDRRREKIQRARDKEREERRKEAKAELLLSKMVATRARKERQRKRREADMATASTYPNTKAMPKKRRKGAN